MTLKGGRREGLARAGCRTLGRTLAIGLCVVGGIAAAPPATDLMQIARAEARLAHVGYRVATANAARCRAPSAELGAVFHDLASYEQVQRAVVRRQYGLTWGFQIRILVPDSPASRAGLLPGDELVGLDSRDLETFDIAAVGAAASYDRVQAFLDLLDRADATAQLRVRRAGAVRYVTVAVARGCGGRTSVDPSGRQAAWSDGRFAAVTVGMMRFAVTDDELAFIVAHEFAHNILGHGVRDHDDNGKAVTPSGRRAETEADRLAVTLMHAAGYDVRGGLFFLRRYGKAHPLAFDFTHPGIGTRIINVTRAIAELPAATAARS